MNKNEPTTAQGWIDKVPIYLMANDHENAARCYMSALAVDPTNIDALSGIASIKEDEGDLVSALWWYDKLLCYHPDYETGLQMKINYLKRLGRLNEAIETCDRLIAIVPDDGSHKTVLCNVWEDKAKMYGDLNDEENRQKCLKEIPKYY